MSSAVASLAGVFVLVCFASTASCDPGIICQRECDDPPTNICWHFCDPETDASMVRLLFHPITIKDTVLEFEDKGRMTYCKEEEEEEYKQPQNWREPPCECGYDGETGLCARNCL